MPYTYLGNLLTVYAVLAIVPNNKMSCEAINVLLKPFAMPWWMA